MDKLPLFVKSGSIVPMYPQMNYDEEKPLDVLTLDIYPNATTEYQLYEDDGKTREHRKGIFATTEITDEQKTNSEVVTINAINGSYKGMLENRSYELLIHSSKKPKSITVNGKKIKDWTFDSTVKKGVTRINCGKWNVNEKVVVAIQ